MLCKLRTLALAAACAAALAALSGAAAPSARADGTSAITVARNHLLRNGVPWVPRGVQIVGLVAPDAALSGKYVAAHAHYGTAELQAAVADHADTVRFQVSEFGIDPDGPLYSPGYVDEVLNAVQAARNLGLAVIVSLQAEPPAGEPTRCPLPDAGAARAWAVLAPAFAQDPDVMFELYNEPGVSATPAGWLQWRAGGEIISPNGSACQAVGMQSLINQIRTQAPQNVIIVPGLGGEQSLAGRLALVDPAHRGDPQLAYGIHYPSQSKGAATWDKAFGNASASVPVVVTEWDANSTTGCIPQTPAATALLLDYLAAKRIGVVGFAFDLPGTIVADYSYAPTTYAGFACGLPGGGPGQILFGDYAGEAQAGDGARPDPAPAWLVSAGSLARLATAAPALTAAAFDTPRTFVTGADAGTLGSLFAPAAVATQTFSDERALAAAVAAGTLHPGVAAVVYAPASARATPRPEQRDPAHYTQLAARVAHAHDLLLIAAPALNLITALAPGTAPGSRETAFLRLGVAAGAARYADALVVPAQDAEAYPDGYASFTAAAAGQATRAKPGIEVLAGLRAGPRPPVATATTLFDAFLGTRLTVSGYSLTGTGVSGTSAELSFLRRLQRLDG
jgi:hypothetical protein